MKGEASIFTEQGVTRIKAPFHGITEAGTKKELYLFHEGVYFYCHVHRTDCLTVDEVIEEVTCNEF